MAELLLPEDAENNTYKNLKTSVSTKIDSNLLEKNINSTIEHKKNTTRQNDSNKQNSNIQIRENEQKHLQFTPPASISLLPPTSPIKIYQHLTNDSTNPELMLNNKIGTDNSANVGIYLLNSTLQQPNGFNAFNEPQTTPSFCLNSTNSNPYFNIDTSNLTNSVTMSYNCFANANSVHFQVPSTVSPSSSLLSLSANSPFSSSASSPGVITGNATAAAAAAAALCFSRNNGFSLCDSFDSINPPIQVAGSSERKASNENNIIAPTPIYAASLVSNLIKEHQNPLFRK